MNEPGGKQGDRIELADGMVIPVVQEWYERLNKTFQESSEIIIDGSPVQQIDGIGLQLLVAFVAECKAKSITVKWDGVSDTLYKNAVLLGLDEKLEFDMLLSVD